MMKEVAQMLPNDYRGQGSTKIREGGGQICQILYYTVKNIRLPDLLLDLQAACSDENLTNVLKKYTNPVLLIIDEWLLLKLTGAEAMDLFELIYKRR